MSHKHVFLLLIATLIITCLVPLITSQTMAESLSPDDPQSPMDYFLSYIPLVVLGELINQTPQPTLGTTPTPITPSPTTPAPTTPSPTTTPLPIPDGMILVDHRHIDLFDQIPPQYLDAARNLRMLFSDRSVGDNINSALDCLTASSWYLSSSSCRRDYYAIQGSEWLWKTFTEDDFLNNTVPERILFSPDPVLYDRSNWTFEFKMGTWSELTQDFILSLAPQYIPTKDILSYQFSYLNVGDDSDIADPETGFFANTDAYDIYDLEAFIDQHPDKIFIFWTSSLARGIGSQISTDFNNQMRQYAISHNKILFDVADIEAHTDQGIACFDNRDGVEYCGNQGCENFPNDGLDLPAICQDWTTEFNGGHLGSVSGGGIRIAKAFWVLMAQIAGWDGIPSEQLNRTDHGDR